MAPLSYYIHLPSEPIGRRKVVPDTDLGYRIMEILNIEHAVILWEDELTRKIINDQLCCFFKAYQENNKMFSREYLVDQIYCKHHSVGLCIIPTTPTYKLLGGNAAAYKVDETNETIKTYLENIQTFNINSYGSIRVLVIGKDEPVEVNTSDIYKCEIVR